MPSTINSIIQRMRAFTGYLRSLKHGKVVEAHCRLSHKIDGSRNGKGKTQLMHGLEIPIVISLTYV